MPRRIAHEWVNAEWIWRKHLCLINVDELEPLVGAEDRVES